MDWQYESVAQRGTAGRRHVLPRGRVLGGTSSPQRDGLPARRGRGLRRLGQRRLRGLGLGAGAPAFEELEDTCPRATSRSATRFSQVFIDAAVEVGLPFNPDFDDGDLDGCGWNRSTIADGRRHNSYRAFLHPCSTDRTSR